MEKKTCHYCKKDYDYVNFGVYDDVVDEFYCYNCVEHCSECNEVSPRDESFCCDYEYDGVACNNHFHHDCGTFDEKKEWFCGNHKKYAKNE